MFWYSSSWLLLFQWWWLLWIPTVPVVTPSSLEPCSWVMLYLAVHLWKTGRTILASMWLCIVLRVLGSMYLCAFWLVMRHPMRLPIVLSITLFLCDYTFLQVWWCCHGWALCSAISSHRLCGWAASLEFCHVTSCHPDVLSTCIWCHCRAISHYAWAGFPCLSCSVISCKVP